MKKVNLGTFFGYDMYLEVSDDDTIDYVKAWENWVGMTKRHAVEQYKDELFLKDIKFKTEKVLPFRFRDLFKIK